MSALLSPLADAEREAIAAWAAEALERNGFTAEGQPTGKGRVERLPAKLNPEPPRRR